MTGSTPEPERRQEIKMSYNYLSDYKKYNQHYRTDNEAGLLISVIHLPSNAVKTRLSRLMLVLVPYFGENGGCNR